MLVSRRFVSIKPGRLPPLTALASPSSSLITSHQPSFITKTLVNTRPFSSTTTRHQSSKMASNVSANTLIEIMKNRRSYYAQNKELTISKERVVEIVNDLTLHTPSSFNSQTNRVVVLFGAEHDKLWDIVGETLKAMVSEEQWKSTSGRIAGFKAGAGTVLFFVEQEGVKAMQNAFATYADKFPHWGVESLAMQQYLTWAALEAEGLGANLQHYNPLIDQKVAETWKVDPSWKLDAQLVFGGRAGEPGPKDYKPLEERVKVFGA